MIDCLLIMIKNISNLVPAAFLIENSEGRHYAMEIVDRTPSFIELVTQEKTIVCGED